MSEDVAIINDPGKFEGERAYMPLAFEEYLAGNCTEANKNCKPKTFLLKGN